MKVARCRDWKLIWELATDPSIFPHISDDFTTEPRKWVPPQNEQMICLVAWDGDNPTGFGIFAPTNWVCYTAHVGFLPRSYGAKSIAGFKEMLRWMWEHTKAVRIVGEIAIENRRAIAFVRRAGFVAYGINSKSILRGGILRDQVALGISRP